jgi:hypothetical protein
MKEKMQNLIKLLNEYEEWKSENYTHWNYVWWYDEEFWCIFASRFPDNTFISFDESIAIIICKWYNFIKWLVDNDKIDLEEYKNESGLYTLKVIYWTDHYIDLLTNKVNSDFLLMLLSIQDNPIEFLVSILK